MHIHRLWNNSIVMNTAKHMVALYLQVIVWLNVAKCTPATAVCPFQGCLEHIMTDKWLHIILFPPENDEIWLVRLWPCISFFYIISFQKNMVSKVFFFWKMSMTQGCLSHLAIHAALQRTQGTLFAWSCSCVYKRWKQRLCGAKGKTNGQCCITTFNKLWVPSAAPVFWSHLRLKCPSWFSGARENDLHGDWTFQEC